MRSLAALLGLVVVCGCGSRGAATFTIHAPSAPSLDPIGPTVTEYSLERLDGTLIGVVSQTVSSPTTLALGALTPIATPTDLTLSVLSANNLLGMARIADVTIASGQNKSYVAEVRKALIAVSSTLPAEMDPRNHLRAGQLQDPSTGTDLANPPSSSAGSAPPPQLPAGAPATTFSWDGRFLFAAHPAPGSANEGALTVIDTGSGATIGDLALSFTPRRVAASQHDGVVALLDRAGAVELITDVPTLTEMPAKVSHALPIGLAGTMARSFAFSSDGNLLYVLSGDPDADPCNGAPPSTNSIVVLASSDGALVGTYNLPQFASDLAVSSATGKIYLSESSAGRVSELDPGSGFGSVTPALLVPAGCPSALRVVNEALFVVTAERDANDSSAFVLERVPVAHPELAVRLPFHEPVYDENLLAPMPSAMPGSTTVNLKLHPNSIFAYEMAVTPDGSRAVFATRARYLQTPAQSFTFLGETCSPNLDIVEYGLYTMDTRSGTTDYESRSQLTVMPVNDYCVVCTLAPFGTDVQMPCNSTPGDRAVGLSALFGGT